MPCPGSQISYHFKPRFKPLHLLTSYSDLILLAITQGHTHPHNMHALRSVQLLASRSTCTEQIPRTGNKKKKKEKSYYEDRTDGTDDTQGMARQVYCVRAATSCALFLSVFPMVLPPSLITPFSCL